MMLRRFIFCLVAILAACNNPAGNQGQEKVELTPFEQFADSVPSLNIPYVLSSNEAFEYSDIVSENIPEGARLIGKLRSINGFYFLLYSYSADIQLPILEIYDSNGKKVNEAVLFQYGACPITSNGHSKCTIKNKTIVLETVCNADNFNVKSDTITIQHLLKTSE